MHWTPNIAEKLMLLVAWLVTCAAVIAQEVLPPEQAFPYSIEASNDNLLVNFKVQDGYYLYRDKFSF